MIDNGDIEVTIHTGPIVRTVAVRACDPVQMALSAFPGCSRMKIVHDHSILLTGFSWAFYGIEDGAHIYTIPEVTEVAPPPEPPVRQEHGTCSIDGFRRLFAEIHGEDYDTKLCSRCYALSHAKLGQQIARLKDRFFERVEGSVRAHRKMIRQFFCPIKRESDDSGDGSDGPKERK